MKKLLIIFVMLILVTSIFAEQKNLQYAIKSGYVKYDLTGSTTGTRTVYWDNYGEKYRSETKAKTTVKIFGIESITEIDELNIIVEDKFWTTNFIDDKSSTGTLPYYEEVREYTKDMTEKEQKELADEIINSMGGQREGSEKFFGYNCEIIKIIGSKIWIYSGITLKSEVSVLGINNFETVIEFKPNSSVSKSKFVPSTSVDFEDIDNQKQQMFGNLGDAMNQMDNYEEEDYDDDYTMLPLIYPFESFKKVVDNFEYEGYKNIMGVRTDENQYIATFMKNFSSTIMIVASSIHNDENFEENGDFESFKYNKKKCYYGNIEDEDGAILVVEYPKDEMRIMIMTTPDKDKDSILKIYDKLKF